MDSDKYIKQVKTTTVTISLRKDGIMETRPNPEFDKVEEVKHAEENMKAIQELIGDKLYPVLNFMPNHYVNHEAQMYYKNHKPLATASAMIANTFVEKLIANFFIKFQTLPIPTRMFSTEEKALKWLEKFKERNDNNNAA